MIIILKWPDIDGLLRNRELRELREKETSPIDVKYMFNKLHTLRTYFTLLEEYDEEDFQLRFRLFQ